MERKEFIKTELAVGAVIDQIYKMWNNNLADVIRHEDYFSGEFLIWCKNGAVFNTDIKELDNKSVEVMKRLAPIVDKLTDAIAEELGEYGD